jgi:hypothetical protein
VCAASSAYHRPVHPPLRDVWHLCCVCGTHVQVVMGEEVPGPLLERLSSLYADLTIGLVAWPYLDLPFTPWRRCVQLPRGTGALKPLCIKISVSRTEIGVCTAPRACAGPYRSTPTLGGLYLVCSCYLLWCLALSHCTVGLAVCLVPCVVQGCACA